MNRILALVFSKDRAAQLDLLLRSMKRNCDGVFKTVVLFKATNYNYLTGYKKVMKRVGTGMYDEVEFVLEDNFKEQVLGILEESVDEHNCVCFLTDDSVFYREFKLDDVELNDFFHVYDVLSFSTRLGKNIKYQNHWHPLQKVTNVQKEPVEFTTGGSGFYWEVASAKLEEDYGRPISMDGNIHSINTMLYLLNTHKWNCVRTLDAIQPRNTDVLSSAFDTSVLVNIPINLVYGGNTDNYGKSVKIGQEELNGKFLQGNDLDLSIVQDSEVESSHKEYDFFPAHSVEDVKALKPLGNAPPYHNISKEEKEDIENWLPSEEQATELFKDDSELFGEGERGVTF